MEKVDKSHRLAKVHLDQKLPNPHKSKAFVPWGKFVSTTHRDSGVWLVINFPLDPSFLEVSSRVSFGSFNFLFEIALLVSGAFSEVNGIDFRILGIFWESPAASAELLEFASEAVP